MTTTCLNAARAARCPAPLARDVSPPQTPQVLRAFCFDHITDPNTHVVPQPPPPAPNPPARRDPFLLELGNIELGSKVQLVSLTDDPAASFEEGAVFELQFTGYDSNARRGTVLLSAAEMEKKCIAPGERLLLRVVDDNGQASEAVNVNVDPHRWANNQQIDTHDEAGNVVRLQGAPVTFTDGFVAPGDDVNAFTKSTFGATLTDTTPPKLLADNVSVRTFEWSKIEQEMFTAIGNTQHFANGSIDQGVAWCAQPGNLETIPLEYRAIVADMAKDDGALMRKMVASQNPALTDAQARALPLTQAMFQQQASAIASALGSTDGKQTFLVFRDALEPGVSIAVQNNSTGTNQNARLNDTQRKQFVPLALRDGDKVAVQISDGNGVRGAPYAFEYDAGSKNGKRAESGGTYKNPLDMRLATRTVKLNGE